MSEFDIEKLGVFQIFTGGGTGTGFLIEPKLLITNAHVVAPYRQVAVELRDKRRILGAVRRVNPTRDLAVVELAQPLPEEVLVLALTDELKAKQVVNIIGFPVGLPLSLTTGVVSNPRQLLGDMHFVQTDAAINPGNSGGPILSARKEIVAVTTCKLTSADNVGFGIPAKDVATFLQGFRAQTEEFGIVCPSCEALITRLDRYCDSCGIDLASHELEGYFSDPELHPVVAFVEDALREAGVEPLLARHGTLNWSFYRGSAAITVWSCCNSHVCFGSRLAKPGKQQLEELFRFLLSPEHAPFAFDLDENLVRLTLTLHMTDVFNTTAHPGLRAAVSQFLQTADRIDNLLIERFGCEPAPLTRLAHLEDAIPPLA